MAKDKWSNAHIDNTDGRSPITCCCGKEVKAGEYHECKKDGFYKEAEEIKMKQPLPVLLSYGDKVYRPAGYRLPEHLEEYVRKNGHIGRYIKGCHAKHVEPKLIVREYTIEDF